MSEFYAFLQLGFQHITDILGYDHIMFIIALCVTYQIHAWRQLLILITAFTIGHSITLALATLQIINFPSALIEFLIPLTILITCIINFFKNTTESTLRSKRLTKYPLAMGFGLIHGMGFSSYLRSLLGRDESIVKQLFAFNLGLELGQILIIAVYLTLSFLVLNILPIRHRTWQIFVSVLVAIMACKLMLEKWPF